MPERRVFSKHSKCRQILSGNWDRCLFLVNWVLIHYTLYSVPFNSAQGFDLEVTDGAMRSKKGKQGVKRRANWSLLGQNCAEPWQNWYILYIYSFTYPKRYSKLNFLNFVHPPLQRAMKSFIMPVSLCPARFLAEQASQPGGQVIGSQPQLARQPGPEFRLTNLASIDSLTKWHHLNWKVTFVQLFGVGRSFSWETP